MRRQEILLIRLFRSKPNQDADMTFPYLGGDVEAAIEETAVYLESTFRNKRIPVLIKPNQARLEGEDGRIIAEFCMLPNGPKRVQKGGGHA